MNVYQAVLAAADHIERNPGLFEFRECRVPDDCGTPGCAIGWVAHFSGVTLSRSGADYACEPVLGLSDTEFYMRMDSLDADGWRRDAALCAKGLRLYASKYLAPPAPVQTFDFQVAA